MTRRAYLHIGLPKTGTTYLQHVVWGNKPRLAEAGLLVPGRNHRHHLHASLDIREDPSLVRRAGEGARPWEDLVVEANKWSGDVLVTHEFFGAAAPDQIRRAVDSLPGFEAHVVVTARPMTALGPARWQEWVKAGGRKPVDSYPPRDDYDPADEWGWGSFDLAEVLDRWGQVVAPQRIHVLPLGPPAAGPEELWRRFAGVLGVDPSCCTVADVPANPRLGVVEVELLRRVNRQLTAFRSAADRGTWIRGYLAEGGALPQRGEPFRVGTAKHQELVERGERAVAMLSGGDYDLVGELAALEPGAPSAARHPSEVTDAEMLESASSVIAHMLGDVRSLTEERGSLQRRVREPKASRPGGGALDALRRATRRLTSKRNESTP